MRQTFDEATDRSFGPKHVPLIRKAMAVALVAVSVSTLPVAGLVRPAAAIVVFDPSNFAENILQAARALEQINNQIQSLQNEATMLQNMARNLQRLDYSSLGQITGALQRIDGLMNQAQGIAFEVGATDAAFQRQFPEQYAATVTTDQLVADILEDVRKTSDLSGDTEKKLKAAVDGYAKSFA